MAPGSRTTQQNPYVNPPADISREQDELAGAPKRFDAGSNKALIPPEAPTLPLVPPPSKDLFTKFIKMFMETTQAQAQVLAELQERIFKARTPETYWDKSHIECYYFCQQYKDHFEISGATGMNSIMFAASFFRGYISFRWAQHKRCHKSATPITWSKFKVFLWKDLRSFQAFIDNIWIKFRKDF